MTPFAALTLATLVLGGCAQPVAYNSAAADHGGSAQSVTPGSSTGAGSTAQPRTSVSSATSNSAEGADDASLVHDVPAQPTRSQAVTPNSAEGADDASVVHNVSPPPAAR